MNKFATFQIWVKDEPQLDNLVTFDQALIIKQKYRDLDAHKPEDVVILHKDYSVIRG